MNLLLKGLAAVVVLAAITYLAGVRVNITKSMPRGFYLVASETVKAGAIVLACPPATSVTKAAQQRGYLGLSPDCSGNFQHLIKRVVAVPGDVVVVQENGFLLVNNKVIPNSRALREDMQGASLGPYFGGRVELKPSEYLLMGDTSKSFDGRYFGPVEQHQILAVLQPIWTF